MHASFSVPSAQRMITVHPYRPNLPPQIGGVSPPAHRLLPARNQQQKRVGRKMLKKFKKIGEKKKRALLAIDAQLRALRAQVAAREAEREALLAEALQADYGLDDSAGWLSGSTLGSTLTELSQATVGNTPSEPNPVPAGQPDHSLPESGLPPPHVPPPPESVTAPGLPEHHILPPDSTAASLPVHPQSTAPRSIVKYFSLNLLKRVGDGESFMGEFCTVRLTVEAGTWLDEVDLTPPDLPLSLVVAGFGTLVDAKRMAEEGDYVCKQIMESVGWHESGWKERMQLDAGRIEDLLLASPEFSERYYDLNSSLSYVQIFATEVDDLGDLDDVEAAPVPDFADTVVEGNMFFNIRAVANHFNPNVSSFDDMLLPTPQNMCLPGRPRSCAPKALLHSYGKEPGDIIKQLEDKFGLTVGVDGAYSPMTVRQVGEQLHDMGKGCEILRAVDLEVLYVTEAPRGPRGGQNTQSFLGLYQDNHLECANVKNIKQNQARAEKRALLESLEEPASPDTALRSLPLVLTRPSPALLPAYGLKLATTAAQVVAHIKAAVANPPTPTRSSPNDVQHSRLDIICNCTDELFDIISGLEARGEGTRTYQHHQTHPLRPDRAHRAAEEQRAPHREHLPTVQQIWCQQAAGGKRGAVLRGPAAGARPRDRPAEQAYHVHPQRKRAVNL